MKILLVDNKGICMDTLLATIGGSADSLEICDTFDEAEQKLKYFKPDMAILSLDLLSPTKQNLLKGIALVIFADEEFMEKAREWAQSGKDIIDKMKENAQRRKQAQDRVQGILDRMKHRTDEARRGYDA